MPDENVTTQDELIDVIQEDEPTPEEIAQWERERQEAWAAKLAPSIAIKDRINASDDYLIDLDFRTSLLELLGGETL